MVKLLLPFPASDLHVCQKLTVLTQPAAIPLVLIASARLANLSALHATESTPQLPAHNILSNTHSSRLRLFIIITLFHQRSLSFTSHQTAMALSTAPSRVKELLERYEQLKAFEQTKNQLIEVRAAVARANIYEFCQGLH